MDLFPSQVTHSLLPLLLPKSVWEWSDHQPAVAGSPSSVLSPLGPKCSSVGTKAGTQWPRRSPHPEQSACQSSVLQAPCPPRTPGRRPVISSRVNALSERFPPSAGSSCLSFLSHFSSSTWCLTCISQALFLSWPLFLSTWCSLFGDVKYLGSFSPYPPNSGDARLSPRPHAHTWPAVPRISGWPPSTQLSAPHTSCPCLPCTAQLWSTSHWLFPGQSFTWAPPLISAALPHFSPNPSPPQALPRTQPAGPPSLPLAVSPLCCCPEVFEIGKSKHLSI